MRHELNCELTILTVPFEGCDRLFDDVRPCAKTCAQHSESVEKLLIASSAKLRLRIRSCHVGSNGVNENGSKTHAGASLQSSTELD